MVLLSVIRETKKEMVTPTLILVVVSLTKFFSNRDYITSNKRVISELLIVKDLEGSHRSWPNV